MSIKSFSELEQILIRNYMKKVDAGIPRTPLEKKAYTKYLNHLSPICVIQGCTSRRWSHHMCKLHRKRLIEHGDPLWEPPPKPVLLCEVAGCDRKRTTISGLCRMHNERFRVTGTIGGSEPRKRGVKPKLLWISENIRREATSAHYDLYTKRIEVSDERRAILAEYQRLRKLGPPQ